MHLELIRSVKATAVLASALLITSCASTPPQYQPANVETREVEIDEPVVKTEPKPQPNTELATGALEVGRFFDEKF